MPGRRCTVAVCKNSARKTAGTGIMYHTFPKDPVLRAVWVQKCKRDGVWNPDSCRICSVHFTEDSYQRDLQAELLETPIKKRLKSNAIPMLRLLPKPLEENSAQKTKHAAARASRHLRRAQKKEVADLVKEKSLDQESLSNVVLARPDESIPSTSAQDFSLSNEKELLLKKIEMLKKENPTKQCKVQEIPVNNSNVDPVPSTSSSSSLQEVISPQTSFSHKEIIALGKQWAREFQKLQPDQQLYAKIAIENVLAVAKMNELHSNSVTINADSSIKTVKASRDSKYVEYNIDPSSKSSPVSVTVNDIDNSNPALTESVNNSFNSVKIDIDYHDVSVKTENIGTYDDHNDDSSATSRNIKTEEPLLYDGHNYIDSVSVKTEHRAGISDNNEHLHLQYVDSGAGSIKSEVIEYEDNNDNSNSVNMMNVDSDNSEKIELFDST